MSVSDDRSTLELISRPSDIQPLSDTDEDTICVFFDNGRVVNSRGRPRLLENMETAASELFAEQTTKMQLEALWGLLRTLSQIKEDLEHLRDNCSTVHDKMSALEDKVNNKDSRPPVKFEEYSRVITPLAAFPNGGSNNKVASINSSGIAPVEDSKYAPDLSNRNLLDKSYSTFNGDHSSLMTRSFASNAVSDKPDPIHIIKSKLMNKKVTLNIGGERHEVLWKTLEHMPQSRLGLLAAASTDEAIMRCVDT